MKPLLTIADLAESLRIAPSTISRYVYDGELAFVRVAGRMMFEPAEVERFIGARRVRVSTRSSARPGDPTRNRRPARSTKNADDGGAHGIPQ